MFTVIIIINMVLSKRNELILSSVVLIVSAWFAYIAFYELFINKPGVHYPRIIIKQSGNGSLTVEFVLNTPTTTNIIILFSSLLSFYFSIRIFIISITGVNKRTLKYWIILIAGIVICLFASIYWMSDFFNTAFSGVG